MRRRDQARTPIARAGAEDASEDEAPQRLERLVAHPPRIAPRVDPGIDPILDAVGSEVEEHGGDEPQRHDRQEVIPPTSREVQHREQRRDEDQ